jgi:hypothetical protein
MSERIRYHLDENVSVAIALGLRRSGIDVTLPKEVALLGRSDQPLILALWSHPGL